jgi:hypothetical protein
LRTVHHLHMQMTEMVIEQPIQATRDLIQFQFRRTIPSEERYYKRYY